MRGFMYGAGLRLMECCRLRMKDVDVPRGQLTVRGARGQRPFRDVARTRQPEAMVRQMEWRRALHERGPRARLWVGSNADGAGAEFPHAGLFVAVAIRVASGEVVALVRARAALARHHVHEGAVTRAVAGPLAEVKGRSGYVSHAASLLRDAPASKAGKTFARCRSF